MSAIDELRERLAAGSVVVLDGGTGSEIEARGAPMDDAAWSAGANLTHPDLVRSVHEDYIRAGADVVIANTFAAGPGPLADAGLGHRFAEVNEAGVRLALEARERVGRRPVAVAGSLSPMTFEALRNGGAGGGDPDAQAVRAAYAAQADLLAAAGAELIALEMMASAAHARPALEAASATGLPVWLGVSTRGPYTDGRVTTYDEVELGELLRDLLGGPETVDAVLVMHTSLDDTEAALDAAAAHFDGPLGAYPHEGDWVRPRWIFHELAPAEFARRVAAYRARGAGLLGGCCGIGPAHIAALSAAVSRDGP
jgi:homocysteine S-methyltransferase